MKFKFILICLLVSLNLFAQQPGKIILPSSGFTATPLNPNADGYTSKTISGFNTDDVTESEIPYKKVIAFIPEPTGDLSRGPTGGFTDIVGSVDGSGLYVFNDGTNLLFRMRIGNYISGSKGYSVLIDTDQRFGANGDYADPNYLIGNAGFELEVTLETNFRVAVYNVDGTTNPILMGSYPVTSNSIISVAKSTDSNNPDYFYDFYVPIASLSLAPGTSLRMLPSSTMSPMSSIGGPGSDQYVPENIIYQPPVKLDSLSLGGGGFQPSCTSAPVITSTMVGTNATISGNWTRALSTRPSTATIKLYQNSTLIGTTTASTGVPWSITGLTLVAGDTIYATAQSAGESVCFKSNVIKLIGCSIASQTTTTGLVWSCATQRGFRGTRPSGASIKIYLRTSTGTTLFANDNSTTYKVTYPDAVTWYYDHANGNGGTDPCTGGPTEISFGSYSITAQLPGYCESQYVNFCLGLSATTIPTISQTVLYPTSTTLSGTAVAGSLVSLYVNNNLINSMTALAGGTFSFTGVVLKTDDIVRVSSIASGQCVSSSASLTVGCITGSMPIIKTDGNGNLKIGATDISGTSSEATGTVVTVYKDGIAIGNTTVQANKTWTLSYTIIAGNYSASQQTGSCLASAASTPVTALSLSTICSTITGSYDQYSTSVNGTLNSTFTGIIKLYVDSVMMKTMSVTSVTTFTFSINNNYSDKISPGSTIYVTVQETGKLEGALCPDNSKLVTCSPPTTPLITSPTTVNIFVGQKATFTLDNTVSGVFYVLKDNTNKINKGTSEFGNNSTLNLVTDTFFTTGTYPLKINALDFSGQNCESLIDVTVNVSGTLPVSIISFKGYYNNGKSYLSWLTENESGVLFYELERSFDGRNFSSISVSTAGGSVNRIYQVTDVVNNNDYIYYRVKIINQNNQVNYTNVIKIAPSGNNTKKIIVINNPFNDKIQAYYNSGKNGMVTLQLFDITGKLLVKKSFSTVQGINNLTLSGLSKISKGSYILYLTLETGEKIVAEKILKQ